LLSQTFWAKGAGGNNADEALDVTKDNSGNIISVGYFTNTAQFQGAPFPAFSLTASSAGVPDVFIHKTDASGNTLWAVSAGGPGSERATAVKTDANGDIYITGFYYGTISFGSISLSSVGGSQDIFIAKLNSSGIFQWAVSAGGSLGDYSYGLALDQNSNVFITGQFEGTSTFGSQNLTSQINPQTGLPSFDIFTAKYSSSGVFQWVQQGSAEYNDRGMDLVCDNTGNVYVTGQFSDTITFQNIHNNGIMNAIFIIKYSSSGQELWLRRAAGAYGIGYAIGLYNNQDLYLCGDYTGPMTFFGSPNNFLNDTYTNRIFLAKYTTSGAFVWAQSDASDNPLSARAMAFSSAGDVYLAGEFGCVMNEYSNLYGPGVFNAVGYSDIFVCKYTSAGNRSWERHFGGQGTDKVYGIVEGQNGRPVIAGSFERNLNWPIAGIISHFWPPTNGPALINGGYCNDPEYGSFGVVSSSGLNDAYVCDAIDLSRLPYDFYHRLGPNCLRPQLDVCIEATGQTNCPDTIRLCNPENISANLHQAGWNFAPLYTFSWPNNPASTLYYTYASNTGYYSVTATSVDGCYTVRDSVYVSVATIQPPTITDDHGVNFHQPPSTTTIHACSPDTIVLTGGNIGSNSFHWDPAMSPGIIGRHDSVLAVNASGLYIFYLTSPGGCMSSNMVYVDLQPGGAIIPKSNMPDTFHLCYGDQLNYILYDSITNPAGVVPYPDCFLSYQETWNSTPNLPGSGTNNNCGLGHTFYPVQTGSYIIRDSLRIQSQCGMQAFGFADTIYVIVDPRPAINLTITGSHYICGGDSVELHAVSNGSLLWNTGDTTAIIFANTFGNYAVTSSITDTLTGCNSSFTDYFYISPKPDPVLFVTPATSLVCPNDSVQLHVSTANAINYEWHGPGGIIPGNSQQIYVSTPGFYHCIVMDADSCVLPSNAIEVKQYSTPYLIGQPSVLICPGQTTDILAIADVNSLIQWQAPLSSSSVSQTISSGGIYYCDITSCGIVTHCSILITQYTPLAMATADGPTAICPGDSVILHANSGMLNYVWSPTNYNGEHYTVYAPGTYSVTVTDNNNCSATSNAITVTLNPAVAVNLGADTITCKEDSYVLDAGAGYATYHWNTGSANQSIPVDFTGFYYVTVGNNSGCLYTDSLFIEVINCNYALTNIFTPNGDGVNDVFRFAGEQFKDVECTIIDRWGKQVYSWSGKDGFWDGTNQKKETMPDGTYYYIGTLTDFRGYPYELKGFVQLSR
jgi:gliding motility-associated-like protein